jgi:Lysine-specific metallo-endopeptidase
MRRGLPTATAGRLAALVALLYLSKAEASRAENPVPSPPDRSSVMPMIHPLGLNAIVRMAVVQAHRRLGEPKCRLIFSDSQDESGQPLQQKLDSIGQSGQSYLGWIWFVNSERDSRCKQSNVLAFTSPHSQVVYYCGDRFSRNVTRRGLGSLATTIIHEELHSLGLGENPPSAQEISRRVEERCGS